MRRNKNRRAPREVRTVFRAFERSEFLEWPAWRRLRAVLESNGGSYGVAGPRGAGKSWLMLRAIDDVRHPDDGTRAGIGLWYPSPSEYDPIAFLAGLSEGLANEIERRFRREHPFREAISRRWPLLVFFLVIAFIGVFVPLYFSFYDGYTGFLYAVGEAAAAAALLVLVPAILLVGVVWAVMRPFRSDVRLLREAALVRERVRYSATRRESAELGAEGGRGLIARARRARERELVERPVTLSSFVNDFRDLAEQAGRVTGRVVVAIDELDKMADPARVRALLRDVKGILEVPRVHFLVSVSDEAARSLNLGALAGRDEFNSSFYTVIELPPAPLAACAELLARRNGVAGDTATVLGVLAGGNPREVVRLAEAAGAAETPAQVTVAALREEALSLRRDIVTAADVEGMPPLGQDARIGSFTRLPDAAFDDPQTFVELAATGLDGEMWDVEWRDAAWETLFEEPWRRLMVRLAVGRRLIENDSSPDQIEQLRDVVVAAAQSAQVARVVLEERLRIES